jgi:hypothetical protein
MKASILAWLATLPWTAADKATETVEARHERMSTIAESVADASHGDRLKAAFILVQFRNETHFDRGVQVCKCTRWRCDPIKTADGILFRAHSLAQVHVENFPDIAGWWSACGIESANVAVNVRVTARFYYPAQLECGYARLAGIRIGCNDPKSKSRAAEARRLSGKL